MTQKVVTNDEAVTGSKNFFAIFGTFGRYITNLRGTFVENVKKVENQPTLLHMRHCRHRLLVTKGRPLQSVSQHICCPGDVTQCGGELGDGGRIMGR
jgi:hypothetical protein